MDFHKGWYTLPTKYGELANDIIAADILGDDTFISFIADTLKIPASRFDTSHTSQEIRKVMRDRLRLSFVVPRLEDTPSNICFVCKATVTRAGHIVTVSCCGRLFHEQRLIDVYLCLYCTTAWGGLNCVMCGGGGATITRGDHKPYLSFGWRSFYRFSCCGADVHPTCISMHSSCPVCQLPPAVDASIFFYRGRKATRRNEAARRNLKLQL